jgi:ferric-dicitrate binding protein FerR (iron transport regulator)
LNGEDKHIDHLISRYLTGEASFEERQQLENWMNESEVNNKYFIDNKFIHDKAVASHTLNRVNVDKAWANLHKQMKSGKTVQMEAKKRVLIPVWLRVAAILVLTIGLGYWLLNIKSAAEKVLAVSNDSTMKVKLADNSQVVLNKKSKITYSKNYGKKNREVTLQGEAYFDVVHSPDTPFVVKAEEILIKDIGTAFNVKAYDNSNTVEVFVEKGEVLLYSADNSGINLKEGEKGIYNRVNHSFTKTTTVETNLLSYKTKLFVFEGAKLSNAINQINAVYTKNIRINNNALMNCSITVTFDNEDIGTIANIIAETLHLKVIELPDGYLLEGSNCNNLIP